MNFFQAKKISANKYQQKAEENMCTGLIMDPALKPQKILIFKEEKYMRISI